MFSYLVTSIISFFSLKDHALSINNILQLYVNILNVIRHVMFLISEVSYSRLLT